MNSSKISKPYFNRRLLSAAAMLLGATICVSASAQSLTFASGIKDGTYSQMLSNMTKMCQGEVGAPLISVGTSGSAANLDALLENNAVAAFVQGDVLASRARTEDLGRIKLFAPLHSEELHFLALNGVREEGGVMGFGAKEVKLNTIHDLDGRKVGAWGGSITTAKVVRLESEIKYQVVEFADQASAMAALGKGQIDAVLAVAGKPVPWIKALDRHYKLLSISEADVGKLKSVYTPTRVSYTNLGQEGVSTMYVRSGIFTRDFRSADYVRVLSSLRTCLRTHIDDLREKPLMHAKWSEVNLDAAMNWPMWTPPAGATTQDSSPAVSAEAPAPVTKAKAHKKN